MYTRFISKVNVNEHLYHFSFVKLFSFFSSKYSVLVFDESGKPLVFKMHLKNNNWKIIFKGNMPHWILDFETELQNCILQAQANQRSYAMIDCNNYSLN